MTQVPTPQTKKPTECAVCYKPLPDTDEREVGPTMYYMPKFTCSNPCHNRYILERCGVGRGWMPIVWKVHNKLTNINPDYRIDQIKAKFGGLRYYVSGIDYYVGEGDERVRSEASKIISAAEDESYETCEWCGEPGKPDTGARWHLTLCPSCKAEREKGSRK